jgi:hypothetical protein
MYYELPKVTLYFLSGGLTRALASCFPSHPFLARPHFLVGGRSGSKELDRASLARRACHRLAEPFQAGCDGAPEGRACGPTVCAASKLCRSKGEPDPLLLCAP